MYQHIEWSINVKRHKTKLIGMQQEQNQTSIWELDLSKGVLFRRYYDALGKIKNKQFGHDYRDDHDRQNYLIILSKLVKRDGW